MIKNSTLLVYTDEKFTREPEIIDIGEMAGLCSELSRLMETLEKSVPAPRQSTMDAIRAAIYR